MESQASAMKAEGRFAALLNPDAPGREAFDTPLLETPDWVVAPTIGAIVPNWLIVVPRQPALNFRCWYDQTGSEPTAIVAEIAEYLAVADDRILWFEHGPKASGTEVGCGVDYAHLHLILDPIFPFEAFVERVEASSRLNWQRSARAEAYRRLTGRDSYLMTGSGYRAVFAEGVEGTGSQFLRKMVGATVGQQDQWNYRRHLHQQNIDRTIATFRALESAAQRDR